MADQTQLDRVDMPTENISATATGEMPSPKLAKDREQLAGTLQAPVFVLGDIVLAVDCVFSYGGT